MSGTQTSGYGTALSRGLPIVTILANHVSKCQLTFRADGTVLFKTTRNTSSGTSYIRMHHQANNGGTAVFSVGFINDGYFDFPEDGSLTYDDVTEANAPVKTYLYKEVCAHSESSLTYTAAKNSTCSAKGNIEYYYNKAIATGSNEY